MSRAERARARSVGRSGGEPLASILRRGQLRVALVALLAVGTLLTAGSVLSLRLSQQHNLELVGRSIAYSAEAAVMFHDAGAAREALTAMAEGEQIASARIVLASGVELVDYRRASAHALRDAMVAWAFPIRAQVNIRRDGAIAATVHLQGESSMFMAALAWSLGGVLLGMVLTGLAVVLVSRRLERRIIDPLRTLAAHTRAIRDQRAFDQRALPAGVREIDELGADFNALLAEVQARETALLQRHEALRSDHADLSFKTQHDALTGAASREHFEQCLAQGVERARVKGGCLGLLFIDADGFKQINDQHGHDVGDRVLVALAQRLRGAVRSHDLVGRLGGDEFVVLIEPLRSAADAQVVAQQLDQAVALPVDIGATGSIVPTISIGVAVYPADGDSAEALLRAADLAMYGCKQVARRLRQPRPFVQKALS